MFGNDITIPHLLIFFPLIAGLISFAIKKDGAARSWALFASLVTLAISLSSLYYAGDKNLSGIGFSYVWMKYLGSSFAVGLDGMGRMLTLLTAIAFPVILIATRNTTYKSSNAFFGLMMLAQSGLMGVFLSLDALLFYFFWELALIPVYFICSRWGGEKRIAATFKFFVYTFAGSLLMLVGIIYVYLHTMPNGSADHSFALRAFYQVQLSATEQNFLFWLFFIAFAIKMPVFPFHTWQPDTYEQSPAAATMVLSGVMVKMGVFAVIRWLVPLFPLAVAKFDNVVIALSVIGMIYASFIAIRQDDLKRFAAYSSIAHIGLMCAAIFTKNELGVQGVMLQMFSHGINIIGLWIIIDLVEKQTGTRKISELGGIASKAPALTILLMIIALANIALPLTNAFVGEFMMFGGLFQYNKWFTVVAGLSIILAAIYTLNMIRKVFYGEPNSITAGVRDISLSSKLVLSVLVLLIFAFGVYPQPLINLTKESVTLITNIKSPL